MPILARAPFGYPPLQRRGKPDRIPPLRKEREGWIRGMLARFLLSCLLLIVIGCESKTVQSAAPMPTPRLVAPPTATEVFNLRSKCAELGDKILENNVVGNALTQEVKSHYNPETNRCYVELDVHAANLDEYEKHPISRIFS